MTKIRKLSLKQMIFYCILFLGVLISIIFVNHNHSFYERPIATVIETNVIDTTEVIDQYNNEDVLYTQEITAELKNGDNKGKHIHLMNEYSLSGAYDYEYQVGHELFVSIDQMKDENNKLTGDIRDLKRDKYIVIITWIFIIVLLAVGKKQGLFASISLALNLIILSYALDINVKTGFNLLLICIFAVIIFTV